MSEKNKETWVLMRQIIANGLNPEVPLEEVDGDDNGSESMHISINESRARNVRSPLLKFLDSLAVKDFVAMEQNTLKLSVARSPP